MSQFPVCFSLGSCLDHSYCLGNISSPVLPMAAAISSNLLCILKAGTGFLVNKNKCTPPDLVMHGIRGNDISLRVFKSCLISIGYSSTSIHPHWQVSSSLRGTTPIEVSPSRCRCHTSTVSGSCRVRPCPSFFMPLAVVFCPVIS